jgi:sugar (pentulose or hexulose) kinase
MVRLASVEEALARMVRLGRAHEPDSTLHEQYAEKHELFKQVYRTLAELNHAL